MEEEPPTSPTVPPISPVPLVAPPPPPPPAPAAPPKPSKNLRKIIGTILVLLLLAAASTYAYFQYYVKDPFDVFRSALEKTSQANSFVAVFQTEISQSTVTVSANYHRGNGVYSQFGLVSNDIEGDPDRDLALSLISDNKNIFITATYSQINQLINELSGAIPGIEDLKTYQLLFPVIQGPKWLRFQIPENLNQKISSASGFASPASDSDEATAELMKKFQDAIIIRNFDRRYSLGGRKFTRLVFGLDKNKLITAVEGLKDINPDLKVSDINDLITLIQSSNAWNSDLAEILIDKSEGYLSSVDLNFPKIDPDQIKNILENAEPQSPLQYFQGFSRQIGGTLTFDRYETAPLVEIPTAIIESNDVLQAAQPELMPLLTPLFNRFLPSSLSLPDASPSAAPE